MTASPVPPATVVANLADRLERDPTGRFLTEAETSRDVDVAGFAALVEGAAARLREEGLRPGDRLAVCLPNGLDVAVAIWACARARLVVVPLPTTVPPPQWAHSLRLTEPRLVLAADEHLEGLRQAGRDAGLPADAVRPLEDALVGRRAEWDVDAPLPDPDEVYGVLGTSGTTGRPKASCLTGRQVMAVARTYVDVLGLGPTDGTAIHLPFSYLSGHVSQLNPVLLAGGSAVTMASFSAPALVRVAAEHAVTLLDVVPSIFTMLLREPRFSPEHLPHLRTAFYGGAPMLAATVDALRERLPGLRLFDVYGMTETGGTIAILRDEEMAGHRGTVGRPVPGVEVRIVDDGGADVAPGTPGELLVRGDVVTPGYFRDPDATAAAITDGWLRTGDVVRQDADGYVSVLDRTKDMINRGGVKVWSAEVEDVLRRHPAVADAAAVGVPDPVTSQQVAVVVVPREGATVDRAAIRAWVREHVGRHAVPRLVRTADALPRGVTGKVDKVLLRRELTEQRG